MLLMAEVTAEMGAELKKSAHAQGIPIAEEIGRRLERLERLESGDSGGQMRVDDTMLRAIDRITSADVYDIIEKAQRRHGR